MNTSTRLDTPCLEWTGAVMSTGYGERNLATVVDLHHLDLDLLAFGHDIARLLDALVAHLGDVNEAVLMHTDIDEGASTQTSTGWLSPRLTGGRPSRGSSSCTSAITDSATATTTFALERLPTTPPTWWRRVDPVPERSIGGANSQRRTWWQFGGDAPLARPP